MKNKKIVISLLVICLAVIIVFNTLFFVIPINKEYSNGSIWISFACCNASIVVSLITTLLVLNKRNIKTSVFGYPLIKESLIFTVLSILYSIFAFSFGSSYELKVWITIVVEVALYCSFAISITLSLHNKKHIETLDAERKFQSSFKKELISRLNDIANHIESDKLYIKINELLDTVTYIDPASLKETEHCEDQILELINELEYSIKNGNFKSEIDLVNEINKLIQNRKNILISNRK